MASPRSKVVLQGNPNYKASGMLSYVWMLRKYGIKPTRPGPYHHSLVHNALVKTLEDGTIGKVTAKDVQNDSSYSAIVSIGTPAQNILLDFDTGSSDLWFWSTRLSQSVIEQGGQFHTVFDPTKSSSFHNMAGSTFDIAFGDQSWATGTVGTDNVTIGGLTIRHQAIELAEQLSAEFVSDTGSSGLLGLALSKINAVKPTAVKTPVENMIAQSDIPTDAELFTAYLGSWRDTAEPDQGKSFYTFGYIDQATVDATGQEVTYTPVKRIPHLPDPQGFWSFDSASYSINGQHTAQPGNMAIADTGTTLMLCSDAFVDAVYNAIPGARYDNPNQGFIFPASLTADQLPVVTIAVGGKQYTIQKEDLSFSDAGNGMVYGGIQSRGNNPFDILGDTFLKSIYAIFDLGNKRFGAVQRIEREQNLDVPPNN